MISRDEIENTLAIILSAYWTKPFNERITAQWIKGKRVYVTHGEVETSLGRVWRERERDKRDEIVLVFIATLDLDLHTGDISSSSSFFFFF